MKKPIIILGILSVTAIFGAFFITLMPFKEAPAATKGTGGAESAISLMSLEKVINGASAATSNAYIVNWETTGFEKSQRVDINLIEMISKTPVIYKFVRKIAQNTLNDGSEIWIPESGEIGPDTYIEVTCTNSISRNGCRIIGRPIALY